MTDYTSGNSALFDHCTDAAARGRRQMGDYATDRLRYLYERNSECVRFYGARNGRGADVDMLASYVRISYRQARELERRMMEL